MNDTKKYSPNACRNHCSIGQHSREVPGIPSLTNIYKIRSLLCLSSQFSYGPLYKINAGTGRRDTEEYNLMLQQKRRGRVAGTEEDKVGCRSVRSHKPVVPSRSETSRPPSYFPSVPTAFLTITSFSCQTFKWSWTGLRLNQGLLCELRLASVGKDPRNSWRILQPRPHGPAVRWTETVTQVRIVGSVDWESFSTGSVNLHKIWESEGCPDDRLIDQAGPSASMLMRDQSWWQVMQLQTIHKSGSNLPTRAY